MSDFACKRLIAFATLAFAALGVQAGEPKVTAVQGTSAAMAFTTSKASATTNHAHQTVAKKKGKSAKKVIANVGRLSSPARRALDRVERSARRCRIGSEFCPDYPRAVVQSQPWRHDSRQSADEKQLPDTPALVPPQADVPGLVPGRESAYKISLNLPIGRDETVQFQAKIRKSLDSPQTIADSTLRADWSLRF